MPICRVVFILRQRRTILWYVVFLGTSTALHLGIFDQPGKTSSSISFLMAGARPAGNQPQPNPEVLPQVAAQGGGPAGPELTCPRAGTQIIFGPAWPHPGHGCSVSAMRQSFSKVRSHAGQWNS